MRDRLLPADPDRRLLDGGLRIVEADQQVVHRAPVDPAFQGQEGAGAEQGHAGEIVHGAVEDQPEQRLRIAVEQARQNLGQGRGEGVAEDGVEGLLILPEQPRSGARARVSRACARTCRPQNRRLASSGASSRPSAAASSSGRVASARRRDAGAPRAAPRRPILGRRKIRDEQGDPIHALSSGPEGRARPARDLGDDLRAHGLDLGIGQGPLLRLQPHRDRHRLRALRDARCPRRGRRRRPP